MVELQDEVKQRNDHAVSGSRQTNEYMPPHFKNIETRQPQSTGQNEKDQQRRVQRLIEPQAKSEKGGSNAESPNRISIVVTT